MCPCCDEEYSDVCAIVAMRNTVNVCALVAVRNVVMCVPLLPRGM